MNAPIGAQLNAIQGLPEEQIFDIFSFIPPLVTSPHVILGVCHTWRLHYSNGVLWRKIYAQHFYEAGTPLPSADGARRECNFKMQVEWERWIREQALRKFRESHYTSLSMRSSETSLPDTGRICIL